MNQASKDGWAGYLKRGESGDDSGNKQSQTYYDYYYPTWYNEPTYYEPLPPAPEPENPWEPIDCFGCDGGDGPSDVEERLAALELKYTELMAKDNAQDARLGPLETVQQGQGVAISGLDTRLGTAEGDIDANESAISSL